MGVEYRHFLIARPNHHRPDGAAVARLIGELRAGRWIPPGDGPSWDVDDDRAAELRYPFVGALDDYPHRYYDVEVVERDDLVYYTGQCIDPFDDTTCECGADLEHYDEQATSWIDLFLRATCPECGRAVDPSAWPAIVRDGMTGEEREVPGGAAFRFALVIDCGKSLPSQSGPVALDPELLAACRRALGTELYEVSDYY
jgi:hypothetical protein